MTLYFLKDTGSLSMTANTFGIALSTVSKHITEVCYAIAKHLGPKYVYLPRNKDEMREATEFEAKFGMPQAFRHLRVNKVYLTNLSNLRSMLQSALELRGSICITNLCWFCKYLLRQQHLQRSISTCSRIILVSQRSIC